MHNERTRLLERYFELMKELALTAAQLLALEIIAVALGWQLVPHLLQIFHAPEVQVLCAYWVMGFPPLILRILFFSPNRSRGPACLLGCYVFTNWGLLAWQYLTDSSSNWILASVLVLGVPGIIVVASVLKVLVEESTELEQEIFPAALLVFPLFVAALLYLSYHAPEPRSVEPSYSTSQNYSFPP